MINQLKKMNKGDIVSVGDHPDRIHFIVVSNDPINQTIELYPRMHFGACRWHKYADLVISE